MTSEGSCDDKPSVSTGSECYVQLPRRVVEQMTETCRLFVMTAAQLTQPTSTANHATQTDKTTSIDDERQRSVVDDNCCSTDIDSLKHTLKELVDKNVCWQTLCNEKDLQILKLKQKLNQAEFLLSQIAPDNTNSRHQCTCNSTDTLRASQRQISSLEQTISSLTESLVDKQTTIDTLQLQVVIYRQDFQSERQDRERAQSQIVELQTQLNELVQQRASAAAASQQVERSHVDYHTHRLPQQHQHRRHYGNVAAAVGWQPWYVSGVDVSDNCDQAGDRQQTKSSF